VIPLQSRFSIHQINFRLDILILMSYNGFIKKNFGKGYCKMEKNVMLWAGAGQIGMAIAPGGSGVMISSQSGRQILGTVAHIEGKLHNFAKRAKNGHGALSAGNINTCCVHVHHS
jgi:hypothetical protein